MGNFWKDGNWAVALAVAIFAVLGFLLWFTNYYDFADVCAADESGELARCAREWLSIWVSAAGMAFAAGTIILLYRQNEGQQRQADFVLGESPPTIDALVNLTDREKAHLRVVNWNRRSMHVTRAYAIVTELSVVPISLRIDGEHINDGTNLTYGRINPFILSGWEDRSSRPHRAEIHFWAFGGGKQVDFPDGIAFALEGTLVGERHKPFRLTAIAGLALERGAQDAALHVPP